MKSKVKYYLFLILSRSNFLSKLYYFFSGKFDLEMSGVVVGRRKYFENELRSENVARLRRDIHRLEKGLVMMPRKIEFGLAYIENTVDQLICLGEGCNKTKLWAVSVLDTYFSETSSKGPSYCSAKDKFIVYFDELELENENRSPQRKPVVNPVQRYAVDEAFNNLVFSRRSVRHYKNKSVDRKLINEAVSLSMQSPTACNRVPYRFFVSDQADLSEQIASCAGGTVGFLKELRHIAVIIADFSNYMYEVDRHAPYIDGSLSAMTFIYALESKGVSSVAINWHEQLERRKQISKFIDLEKYETVVMLVGFGYMSDEAISPFSEKKDLEEVLKYAR